MDDIRENIRRNLAYYLTVTNVAQKELAASLGVTPSAVGNWINGRSTPDIQTISHICNYFEISLTEIVGFSGNEPYTEREKLMVSQYRRKPEFQHSIHCLLNVYEEEEKRRIEQERKIRQQKEQRGKKKEEEEKEAVLE